MSSRTLARWLRTAALVLALCVLIICLSLWMTLAVVATLSQPPGRALQREDLIAGCWSISLRASLGRDRNAEEVQVMESTDSFDLSAVDCSDRISREV